MRQLFLYGGRADNFEQTSQPFIEAAGGHGARIALLFPTGALGWDRNLSWYADPWLQLGVAEVVSIHPVGETARLDDATLSDLQSCTGIFMCGGDTRLYHRVYAQGDAKVIIRDAYQSGIPYAGLSAGALLTPVICPVWGDRLTLPTHTLLLRGSEDGCDEELQLGDGLGFLRNMIIETHFSERGGFPRIVAAMEQAQVAHGLGFDNPICVEIGDETNAKIRGQGRAYLFERSEGHTLVTTVLEPGQKFCLKGE
jgi:cyanophycinase